MIRYDWCDQAWDRVVYKANCALARAVREKDWGTFWTYLNLLDLVSPGQAEYARKYTSPLGRLL